MKQLASHRDGGLRLWRQSCISVRRVYVHRNVFPDIYLEGGGVRFKAGAWELRMTRRQRFGPLARRRAMPEQVEAWIKRKPSKAERSCVAGGERKGSVIMPTILTGTKPGMKVRDEEIAGPVV